jgi:hypothetical protein
VGRRPLRHRRFVRGALTAIPAVSRGQKRGGSTELFAAVSFGRARLGAPLTDAFSAPRMRTPLGPSRTSWSLHRTVSTSDALTVTCRHARPASVPSDALSAARSSRMVQLTIALQAEGPHFTPPVRTMRAKARERLPSYREPASRNPPAEPARTFDRERFSAHRFAFSRLVLRVSEASSFLPASALLVPQQILRSPGGQGARCVRPTSAT